MANRASYAFQYLLGKGYPPAQAARTDGKSRDFRASSAATQSSRASGLFVDPRCYAVIATRRYGSSRFYWP